MEKMSSLLGHGGCGQFQLSFLLWELCESGRINLIVSLDNCERQKDQRKCQNSFWVSLCHPFQPTYDKRESRRHASELHRAADAQGEVDWDVHMVDGTSIRAHRCAAGGKGGSRRRLSDAHGAVTAASSIFAVIGAADRLPSC